MMVYDTPVAQAAASTGCPGTSGWPRAAHKISAKQNNKRDTSLGNDLAPFGHVGESVENVVAAAVAEEGQVAGVK